MMGHEPICSGVGAGHSTGYVGLFMIGMQPVMNDAVTSIAQRGADRLPSMTISAVWNI